MKNWLWVVLVYAFALQLFGLQGASAVPLKIPYVGMLTTESFGIPYVPASGSVTVTAALYFAQSGGAPVWGPVELLDVPVTDGTLAFVLDGESISGTLEGLPVAVDQLFALSPTMWLDLSINGQPMAPRQRILAVPYALVAASAHTLSGMPAEAFATAEDLANLTPIQLGAAPAAHVHAAADITSGQLDPARIPSGTDHSRLALSGGMMQGPIDLAMYPTSRFRFEAASSPPFVCTSGRVGYAYFDTVSDTLKICNGTSFVTSGGGASPFTPNAFSFANVNNVAINAVITSDAVTLTGAGTASVTATCSGCTVEVNASGVFSSTQTGVVSGDSVRIRRNAASAAGTSVTASLAVGSTTSGTWTITTSNALGFGSEFTTNNSHSARFVSAVALSSTKALVVYWESDADLWGVVADRSGASLSFGTPVLLADANVAAYGGYHQRSVAPFDSTRALILYKQFVNGTFYNHKATIQPVVVSGTNISVQSPKVEFGLLNAYKTEIFRMSNNYYVVYSDGLTAGYDGSVGRVTFDGSNFSGSATLMHDEADALYHLLPFPAENRYALIRGSTFYTGQVLASSLTQVGTGTLTADSATNAYGVSIGAGRAVRVSGNRLILHTLSGNTLTENQSVYTVSALSNTLGNGMASEEGGTLYICVSNKVAAVNVSSASPASWSALADATYAPSGSEAYPLVMGDHLAVFYRNGAGRLAGVVAPR